MRTFFIETWGCQMNQHDSERLEGQLRAHGLERAAGAEEADLVLLNTCSVREKPVHKLLTRIGELARLPGSPQVGVCGCVAQQEGEALLARSRAVGFVVGPGQVTRVGEAVRALRQGRRSVLTGFASTDGDGFATVHRSSTTRGMVTVIEGCNEHCTFCVVPYTRGHEVSRPLDDIVAEVRRLAASGLLEIELLGQTVNAYRCPVTGAGFAALLERVARVEGPARVRFVTSHPRHFGGDLIEVLARHPHVSRYLHLPVQSGSDPVLRRMRRRYTRQEYLELVAAIRREVPQVNLSTDIIVGFPGESEDDFRASLDLLAAVRFGQVFAFAYSPRPKTPAARAADQVDEEVKRERLARLFALTDTVSEELNQGLVGREVAVLIDGRSRRAEQWQGRAEDNRLVNFPVTGEEEVGDIVQVRVTWAGPHSLRGELVDGPRRLPVLAAT